MKSDMENTDCVKSFNNELASLYECKPPISKAKMVQITKSAMKAIKYYKHVVMSVEKFIQKCRPEYKLPGLYVIDSIVRQSRHQYGAEKDIFAPRFSKNIAVTFQSLFKCPDEDKLRVVRVIRLWLKNGVFSDDDCLPLLDLAADLGLDVSEGKGERNGKTNAAARLGHTPSPIDQFSPVPERSAATADRRQTHSALDDQAIAGKLDPAVLTQLHKFTSSAGHPTQRVESDRKLTQKLLADYEYSDEESGAEELADTSHAASDSSRQDLSANLAAAAQNLLKNPELLQQIHQMQRSMRSPATQLSNAGTVPQTFPPNFQHPPPPLNTQQAPPQSHVQTQAIHSSFPPTSVSPPPQLPFVRGYENQGMNYPPPAEPIPSERQPSPFGRAHWPTNLASERLLDRDERRRGADSSRKRSGDRRRRSSRSRSRSKSRDGRRRNRSRSAERRNREQERERRKQGLPPIKSKHVSICSRTLWLGRVPNLCEAHEITDGLKDYGEPVSVDLIAPRGCAYVVMPERKSAFKVLDRLRDSLRVQNRVLKMAWAPGKGVKEYKDGWVVEHGVTYLPWDCLPDDLTALLDGGSLDTESLPDELKGTYSEIGKLDSTATPISTTAPVIQPNFSVAPPPFPAFTGVPPPNLFPGGLLPTSFAPPMLTVPIQNPALGAPLHAGTFSGITGVPPPMPVAPPSMNATSANTLRPVPPPSLVNTGETSGGTPISSLVPATPLFGNVPQPPFNRPPPALPPNYTRPIGHPESAGYGHGRSGFFQGNRNDGGFNGQHFRGRGRGMGVRGGGDFGRGRFGRGGGGMQRRDWSAPQSGRFDSAMRNSRSRWSAAGDEQPTPDFDNETHRMSHRSRWGPETENAPSSQLQLDDAAYNDVPAGHHETSYESSEPPPPGE